MNKFTVGSYIEERYKVAEILSKKRAQKVSIVLLCDDRESEEKVVLKTYKPKYRDHLDIIKVFKRKGLIWTLLKGHPRIVETIKITKLEGHYCIIFEYIHPDDGGYNTLKQYLTRELTKKQILTWTIQFCDAMIHAKKKGILAHRDIKLSNIMITREFNLKISDFGLAKMNQKVKKELMKENFPPDGGASAAHFLSIKEDKDLILGSEPWMAPESFQGNYDTRSDIYSFGIVFYHLLNHGKLPFSKQTIKPLLLSPQRAKENSVESALYPILKTCLELKPQNRYKSFDELKEVLAQVCADIIEEKEKKAFPSGIDGKSLLNLGISYHTLGLPSTALKYYMRSLEKGKHREQIYTQIATLLFEQEKFPKGQEYINKGLDHFPHSIALKFLQSKVLLFQQNYLPRQHS